MKKMFKSLVILTFLFILVFNIAQFTQAKTITLYMAGNFNPHPICECPVPIGNCMCKVTLPEPGPQL